MQLKVTTWNVEHLGNALNNPNASHNSRRLSLVAEEIQAIRPDILAIQEGPKGETAIRRFASDTLNGFLQPVLLPGNIPADRQSQEYKIKGTQWMWFLVRPEIRDKARLQPPTVYQHFTDQSKWKVHFWGRHEPDWHSHYRHPQVMILTWDGVDVEFVTVHLKSPINLNPVNGQGEPSPTYVDAALKARIKLATEASDLRRYVHAKFAQKRDPGIVVLGDCNDGPGRGYFEELYLFFDLISNIEGDILSAEEFLNHALFDLKGSLRWSARFRDPVTGKSASENPLLLDHILMSQPLVNGSLPLQVNANAGLVEHEIHERVNAGATTRARTSDHRPVSCYFDVNGT